MKKTTKSGIILMLNGNTVTKKYSNNYINVTSFPTKELAKKEYNKLRKDHKSL